MNRIATLTALLVAGTALHLTAATLYWDGNGDGALGGTGTWSTSGLNGTPAGQWSTSSALTSNPGPYGAWDQAGGQDIADVRFTAINETVTLSGTVTANRLIITSPPTANPNCKIQGGTLNLAGDATLEMKYVVDGANQWIDLNSTVTGSNGLAVTGKGSLTIGGNNSYTGTTTFNNLRTVDLTASTAIPAASLLNLGSVTLRVRPGVHVTAAGLTGTGSLQAQGSGTDPTQRTVTLSRSDGTTQTYTGAWSNTNAPVSLIKRGGYTQVLGGSGANNNPGSLTVEDGVLALAKTGGVAAVSGNVLLTGGTLRLDGANQIADAAAMTLSGGTFNANGFSDTLGTLTLDGTSALDFGAGASTLLFAGGSFVDGLLTISNWDGVFTTGGGTDQLRFASAPGADFLNALRFAGYAPGARALDFGSYVEVLPPIPEPGAALLLALALAALSRRRQRA